MWHACGSYWFNLQRRFTGHTCDYRKFFIRPVLAASRSAPVRPPASTHSFKRSRQQIPNLSVRVVLFFSHFFSISEAPEMSIPKFDLTKWEGICQTKKSVLTVSNNSTYDSHTNAGCSMDDSLDHAKGRGLVSSSSTHSVLHWFHFCIPL
jgi:hypothetical protein